MAKSKKDKIGKILQNLREVDEPGAMNNRPVRIIGAARKRGDRLALKVPESGGSYLLIDPNEIEHIKVIEENPNGDPTVVKARRNHHAELPADEFAAPDVAGLEQLLGGRDRHR